MNRILFLILALMGSQLAFSQLSLTMLPSGGNKKASVSEQIGLTRVSIHYDRPAVKGRDGKIWGELVHAGYTDQQFGTSKAAPWRAGANENTTIEFSTEVRIEGQVLPAGKYGFFIAWDPSVCTLIFSKNAGSWGSYFYNENEDALRITVKPLSSSTSVEWLKYEFTDQTENSAVISLQWEKIIIPFKVEVDYIHTQIASFRQELRTEKGFFWLAWNQAANWCLQRNVNLEEALLWADSATSINFGGDRVFNAWVTKSKILEKLGRKEEARTVMQKALPIAGMTDLHQYGRQLLTLKQPREAFSVFKMNFEKYPGQFTTLMGMARGYSGLGDYKNALKYASMALPLSPDELNKKAVEGIITKLKEGKDIN
ncbi:MAG: DUF2911 domain-containing protein [Chitinophagaceae bacterium]|nr:DUF2911 domain-containing protein [Chitinophagaceae bacterium]